MEEVGAASIEIGGSYENEGEFEGGELQVREEQEQEQEEQEQEESQSQESQQEQSGSGDPLMSLPAPMLMEQEGQEGQQEQEQKKEEEEDKDEDEEEMNGGATEEEKTKEAERLTNLEQFYRIRGNKKSKDKATYKKTGDLQITFEKAKPINIAMPTYRPLTQEELFQNIDRHKKEVAKYQKAYNNAHQNMRTALLSGDKTKIKNTMMKLQTADMLLQNARFREKACVQYDVQTNRVLFNDPKNETTLRIIRFMGSGLTSQQKYVTSESAKPEAPKTSLANVVVINTPEGELGALSHFNQFTQENAFKIDDKSYTSAYKAILNLLASSINKENSQKFIEEMEIYDNPLDLIAYDVFIREGVEVDIIQGHLRTILPRVFREVYRKPEMDALLKSTGDAILVVVPQERPLDAFLGVGIDPNQTELIRDPRKWQGQNIYGNVLMDIRKGIQAPIEVPVASIELPVGEPVAEGTIPIGDEVADDEEMIEEEPLTTEDSS